MARFCNNLLRQSRPIDEDYPSRFLLKLDVISIIMPITIKGIDNGANESVVPEIPAIVSLHAIPKANTHNPKNVITLPVRLYFFKNTIFYLYIHKNLFH